MANLPPITRDDVDDAINHVHSFGIPKNRRSTKFCLVAGNDHLPPKYIVALAAKPSLGRELEPSEFSGGPQTNQLLKELGFKVRACNCGGEVASGVTRPPAATKKKPESKTSKTPKQASKRTEDTARPKPEGLLSGLKRAVSKLLEPEPAAPRAQNKKGRAGDANTTIVRIVVNGQPPGDPRSAERMLLAAFKKWPKSVKTKFAITPGGFVCGTWPKRTTIPLGWDSRGRDFARLTQEAEACLRDVVTSRVFDAAEGRAEVLTIGIDLINGPGDAHAELVAVYDVSARQLVRWTGKSYPTQDQEQELFQVTDLKSHIIELQGERVLVLGCHDLKMYDPRGLSKLTQGSHKHTRTNEIHKLVASFKPTVVLQHPHGTDTPNIWRNTWGRLLKEAPTIRAWGSGIGYYNIHGDPPRDTLEAVLSSTKSNDVIDIPI